MGLAATESAVACRGDRVDVVKLGSSATEVVKILGDDLGQRWRIGHAKRQGAAAVDFGCPAIDDRLDPGVGCVHDFTDPKAALIGNLPKRQFRGMGSDAMCRKTDRAIASEARLLQFE